MAIYCVGSNLITFPTKIISSINIKTLHNEIIQYDDIIRERFQNQILYSNRQANILTAEKLVVTELDTITFQTSEIWKEFEKKVVKNLEDYLLLDCISTFSFPRLVTNA